mmetsp:Transcript_4860/g.11381  ORF Transcript_4860/g.11381 Transcript_4860/m.11381 type:complete len:209 (-) Transcript_4860:213-839(-)
MVGRTLSNASWQPMNCSAVPSVSLSWRSHRPFKVVTHAPAPTICTLLSKTSVPVHECSPCTKILAPGLAVLTACSRERLGSQLAVSFSRTTRSPISGCTRQMTVPFSFPRCREVFNDLCVRSESPCLRCRMLRMLLTGESISIELFSSTDNFLFAMSCATPPTVVIFARSSSGIRGRLFASSNGSFEDGREVDCGAPPIGFRISSFLS